MKISLISPFSDLNAFGIRTISACLKREGHDVDLLFLRKSFTKRYEEKVLDDVAAFSKDSDLIGISVFTNYFNNAAQITEGLKRRCDVPIVWGGIHPTVMPQECLKYADMICIGEAEETVIDLCSKLDGGENLDNIPGTWIDDGKTIIKNQIRPLAENLDYIPPPDYDYRSQYIWHDESIQKMSKKTFDLYHGRNYMTLPTRGCPFGCTYCCNNAINILYPRQKSLRKRSVDNIIDELVNVKTEIPSIKQILFADDCFFNLSRGAIEEFSQKYKERVNLPLDIYGATPSNITREKLSLLISAGMEKVRMGIQTGCEDTKKLYRRRHSNERVEESAKLLNEFKDDLKGIYYDIILDNPWETDDDIIETLMFLTKLPVPYTLSLFSLNFFPGTDLFEKAKADGIISNQPGYGYEKDFGELQKTYLNQLFLLLKGSSSIGINISPKIMAFLINHRLGPSLFRILRVPIVSLVKIKYLSLLSQKSFEVVKRNDWSRMKRYVKAKQIEKET